MPKPSSLSALVVRPYSATLLLLAGVIACTTTVDEIQIEGVSGSVINTSGSGGSAVSAGTS